MIQTPELYRIFLTNPIICTDTRNIVQGCLFFALKGERFNGNEFAHKALEIGAAYAIVDEEKYVIDERFMLVNDVLSSFQELAKFHRTQLKIPVIAICGSNGKTTTKELMHAVLSKKLNTISTKGNLNNHIGVPLTLLTVNQNHEVAIVEMGANHLQETAFLCEISQPNFGMVTNNGKDHLEGFGSVENVKTANAELFEYLRKTGGKAFINADDLEVDQASEGIEKITYGSRPDIFCEGKIVNSDFNLRIKLFNPETEIQSQLFGKYNFSNIMAAACVGKYFGVSYAEIQNAIENYVPQINRSQITKKDGNIVIFDCYNANPASMKSAIESFQETEGKNKVLILADMLEMGEYAEHEHREMIEFVKSTGIEEVYLVGPEFKKAALNTSYKTFANTLELKPLIRNPQFTNRTVLLKGSRGFKLEELYQ